MLARRARAVVLRVFVLVFQAPGGLLPHFLQSFYLQSPPSAWLRLLGRVDPSPP